MRPKTLPDVYHYLDGRLRSRPIVVQLVGVGGTGSQVLTGLGRLHVALLALGHEWGLDVTVFDADRVSPANIGRQLYSHADVGQSKAVALVTRVNLFFGLDWKARCERYTGSESGGADIVITCVDTAKSRRQIAANMTSVGRGPAYWLDCGNARRSGQVFLTRGSGVSTRTVVVPVLGSDFADSLVAGDHIGFDLPTLREVLPEVFDATLPEDDAPSCSLAESLASQDLFVNDHVSRWALHLMWSLLSEGKTSVCGYWINLAEGRVAPVPISRFAAVSGGKARKTGGTNG